MHRELEECYSKYSESTKGSGSSITTKALPTELHTNKLVRNELSVFIDGKVMTSNRKPDNCGARGGIRIHNHMILNQAALPISVQGHLKLEPRVRFELTNNGFAIRSLRPLGYLGINLWEVSRLRILCPAFLADRYVFRLVAGPNPKMDVVWWSGYPVTIRNLNFGKVAWLHFHSTRVSFDTSYFPL